MKKTTHIILIFILFIVTFFPSKATALTQILGVRHWSAPDYTRVVIDFSEKAVFETTEKGRTIRIDIHNALFPQSIPHEYILNDSAIRTIFLIPLTQKRVRVEITLSKERKSRIFTLGKILHKPHRIVVDVAIPEIEKKQSEDRQRVKISKKKKVVVIDPGHGGEDPGAVGPHKTLEKDIVLNISRNLRNILREKGYDAFLTRNGDYYISFKKRMDVAREYGADLFLSIHTDSFRSKRAKGSSVYTLSLKGASSEAARLLAESENLSDIIGGTANDLNGGDSAPITLNMLQTETINQSKALGMATLKHLQHVIKPRISTVQEAPFRVLKLPDITSILVEVAYISNPGEERLLRRKDYQRKIANAVASAIVDFLPTTPPGLTVVQNTASSLSPPSATPQPISEKSPINPGTGATHDIKASPKGKELQSTVKQDSQKEIILHRVKRGDNLEKIARTYHTTVQSIMTSNGLKLKNRILVGQELKIGPSQLIHVVRRGDNLEKIARTYGTTIQSIMMSNGLKSKNRILVGQKLKISPPQLIHIVQRGDNLKGIAKKYKTSVDILMKLNNIRSKNRIYINQRLTLPQNRNTLN
jgi:N-acetylmuramoyl-L-alanine amidase